MICILIKCSASLFSHTVQYASAPVALKLHPSCCYNTCSGSVCGSYHHFPASHYHPLHILSKSLIHGNVTFLIWQSGVGKDGISTTQSLLNLNTMKNLLQQIIYMLVNSYLTAKLYSGSFF